MISLLKLFRVNVLVIEKDKIFFDSLKVKINLIITLDNNKFRSIKREL